MLICACAQNGEAKYSSCNIHRCTDRVYGRGRFHSFNGHRCQRKATAVDKYGYGVCTTHNEVIRDQKRKAKWAEQDRIYQEKSRNRARQEKIDIQKDLIIDALKDPSLRRYLSETIIKMVDNLIELEKS